MDKHMPTSEQAGLDTQTPLQAVAETTTIPQEHISDAPGPPQTEPAAQPTEQRAEALADSAETQTTDTEQPVAPAEPAVQEDTPQTPPDIQTAVEPKTTPEKPAKTPDSPAKLAASQAHKKRKKRPQVSYQPKAVFERMKNKPGILQGYVSESKNLLWTIHNQGLGVAIALLLTDANQKRKRRIYHDLVKWTFREKRLRGKNNRSLMDSIVYGRPSQVQTYTAAVVAYLEAFLQMSHEHAKTGGAKHE